MLEFDIIESPHKMLKNELFRSMIEKMKFFQGLDIPLGARVNPVFIIVEGEKRKIIGGACLLKKNLSDVQEEVADLIGALTSPYEQGWECSTIYFDGPSSFLSRHSEEVHLFMQDFYRKLYEGLVAFGVRKNIHFVIMKLLYDTYLATRDIGLWPYVVELKPPQSPDGLFHGVLPLVGKQYNAYKNIWADQDRPF